MVPSIVLTRVFNLRIGLETATGFTIEADGRQYLITAKHFVASSPPSGEIDVFHDKNWIKMPFRLIPVEPNTVDIAVLALNQQLSGVLPISVGIKRLIPLSQGRLYVVPERIRRVEFGHRAALKMRYPVAFQLPSYGGVAYA